MGIQKHMSPKRFISIGITCALLALELTQTAYISYYSRIAQAQENLEHSHSAHTLLLTNNEANSSTLKTKLLQLKAEYKLTAVNSLADNNETIQVAFAPEEDLAMIIASQNTLQLEPDYLLSTQSIPTETQYSEQWYLHNTAQTYHTSATSTSHGTAGIDINWQNSYDISSIRGQGVKVAIIDSGLRIGHPDLLDNVWTNTSELSDGMDNDSNGFIDDIHGWNFLDHNNDLTDNLGHGTEAAGFIAADDNHLGIAGIASSAQIMPLKVLDDDGNGSTSNVIAAMNYAVAKGANIINMSFGAAGIQSTALTTACTNALNHGVMLIAAAGNNNADIDSTHFAPADIPGVMAVGSITNSGTKASFSNTGSALSIVTPGVQVVTTRSRGTRESSSSVLPDGSNNYIIVSGTSFSAPMTAGAAALLISQNPDSTVNDIRTRLEQSAHDLGSNGKDSQFGYGLLDVSNALQITMSPPTNQAPTISSAAWDQNPIEMGDSTTLTITANDTESEPLTVTADFSTLGIPEQTLSAGSANQYHSTTITPTVSAGNYEVPYAVSDASHTATGSIALTIQTSPTVLTITSPSSESTYATEENAITLSGTVSNTVHTITINDNPLTTFTPGQTSWSENFNLDIGTNTFIVRAFNAAQQLTSSDSITITRISPETPTVSVTPTPTPEAIDTPTITSHHRTRHHSSSSDPIVTAQSAPSFYDIATDHFAANQIADLAQKGAVHGYNGFFLPNRTMSRGEFLQVAMIDANLISAACSGESNHFSDTAGTFNPIVNCAIYQHIITDSNGQFLPYAPITRAQAILWLIAIRKVTPQAASTTFLDVTNPLIIPYIETARQKQWVSGFNGLFYPSNFLSRAEAAKIIVNSRH